MHFSFSAVNENADENEIPFSAEKRKRKSTVSLSQNLVTVQLRIKIFRPNTNDIFWNENKKIAYNENENSFSAENEKTESDQIAHFLRRKRKRISVGFWFDGLT